MVRTVLAVIVAAQPAAAQRPMPAFSLARVAPPDEPDVLPLYPALGQLGTTSPGVMAQFRAWPDATRLLSAARQSD